MTRQCDSTVRKLSYANDLLESISHIMEIADYQRSLRGVMRKIS